jgi:putative phosphoribosyl transferase
MSLEEWNEMVTLQFADRIQAGQFLATKLTDYAHRNDVLVLALPRGGVPVAYEVAKALNAPLDIFVVRKLGVPGHEEMAMGAIASGGARVINQDVVLGAGIATDVIQQKTVQEWRKLERREKLYRGDRPAPQIAGRTVILIDDGLATGATMHAAVLALRQHQPAKIIVAVPAASRETCAEFQSEVDGVVCGITPEPFLAVGLWFENFAQTTDDEVRLLLHKAAQEYTGAARSR